MRHADQPLKALIAALANGSSTPAPPASATPTVQALWRHAEAPQPQAPWRAVAHALGISEARCLDAYRNRIAPPGITWPTSRALLRCPRSPKSCYIAPSLRCVRAVRGEAQAARPPRSLLAW
jgi:hypothetical protein